MVIVKRIETMCRAGDNKIIHTLKWQSMTFHMTTQKDLNKQLPDILLLPQKT